ncbi:hypothetical protein ACSW9O_15665 (plasmid) [Clostridium perfringens]|nr:hypothetical protein [Clostridium perfringens]
MMGFLTICFILIYGWRLFYKHGTFISLYNKICAGKTNDELQKKIKQDIESGECGDIAQLLIMIMWMILWLIIQAFYILFALRYCNMFIWGIYVVYIILDLIISKIKASLRKGLPNRPIKYTFGTFLGYVFHLIFFLYMFYILFI